MNEIKFRVWDGVGMYHATLEDICKEIGFEYGIPDNVSAFSPDWSEIQKIMQWTGLCDKNGKEIYEGDIVECREPYNDLEVAVIRWDDKLAKFVFDMYYDGETEITETLDADNWVSVNHFEIVGNIYQNPELLQE